MKAYYFGCVGQAGHYFFDERLRSLGRNDTPKFFDRRVDGQFAPRTSPKSRMDRGDELPNGHARVTQVDGWTVLSFWDNSVDKRGASNSIFFFPEIIDGEYALTAARDVFPTIFARFDFEVKIVETVITEDVLS